MNSRLQRQVLSDKIIKYLIRIIHILKNPQKRLDKGLVYFLDIVVNKCEVKYPLGYLLSIHVQ